jgi:hypothetical protein
MHDAVQRVRTPYVMLADNDDFLGLSGIEKALDILDADSSYVCARGQMVAFSAYSGFRNPSKGLRGDLNDICLQYHMGDAREPTVVERLRQGLDIARYNAVYRSAALVTIWREVAKINFSDLMLHEIFHSMRTVTLGKAYVVREAISYFRQLGTSSTYDPSRDWVRHLLRSHFTSDIEAMVDCISKSATDDLAERVVVAEDVRSGIEQYFRKFLYMNFGPANQLKQTVRRNFPNLTVYLQNRRRLFVKRKWSRLVSVLAQAGATPKDLQRTCAELADIETTLCQDPRLDSTQSADRLRAEVSEQHP